MESFRVKGKETRELHQLFKKLEQDWHAFKESKPTRASRKHRAPSSATVESIIQQGDIISPRELMSKLQRDSSSSSPTEAWKNVMRTRINDVAAQEIIQDRRDAIESGKLKGRRLFQSTTVEMEGGHESAAYNMGPQREERSMSFHYSEDDEHDENESSGSKGLHGYSCSSSSSSSSPCLVGAFMDKDIQEVKEVAHTVAEIRVASSICRHGNGTRYAVFLGVFVAAALLMVAVCMSLARSFGGYDYDVILVPT